MNYKELSKDHIRAHYIYALNTQKVNYQMLSDATRISDLRATIINPTIEEYEMMYLGAHYTLESLLEALGVK